MSNNVSHWKRFKLNVWITLYVPAKKFINNIFFAERATYPSSKRQQMNNDRVRAKERQTEREKQHLIYLISFNIHKYNRILCHLCAHVHTSRSWSAQNITNLIIHSCAYNKGRSAECWLNGEKDAKKMYVLYVEWEIHQRRIREFLMKFSIRTLLLKITLGVSFVQNGNIFLSSFSHEPLLCSTFNQRQIVFI